MIAPRVIIAMLVLSLAPSRVWACSCSNGGPRNALRRSAAVYLGRVVEIGKVRRTQYISYRLTRLVVTQALKGVRAADTVAVDAEIENSCAAELQLGREYLVYAVTDSRAGTIPVTDHCAGTTTIACAADDLRALRAPVPRRAKSCRPSRPGS